MGANLSKSKLISHGSDNDSDQDDLPYEESHPYVGHILPHQTPAASMNNDICQQIGALISICKTNQKIKYGTGVLISPDLVLTVAHNIFDMKTREDYHNIKFYPGQYGVLEKFYEVQKYYYPRPYRLDPSTKNDFAILKLKEKASQFKNIFPLSWNLDGIRKNESTIMIAGYPEAHYNRMASLGHRHESAHQYFFTKAFSIQKINERRGQIIHNCPAMKGQDGAPIIGIDTYERMMIIGIHRGGLGKQVKCKSYIGRLMTQQLIQLLHNQAVKMNAQPFVIKFPPINELLMGPKQHHNIEDQLKKQQQHIEMLFQNQKFQEVIQILLKVIQENPNNMKFHYLIGVAYFNIDNFTDAIKHLRICQRLNSSNYYVFYMLGASLYMKEHFNEANMYFQKALDLQPPNDSLDIYVALGRVAKDIRQESEAQKWFQKSIQNFPSQIESYLRLASIKGSMNQFQEVKNLLLKAIENNLNEDKIFDSLKTTFEKLQDLDGGLQFFKKQSKKIPSNSKVVQIIATLFWKTKRIQQGIEFIRKHIEQYSLTDQIFKKTMMKLLFLTDRLKQIEQFISQYNINAEQLYLEWGCYFYIEEKLSQSQKCFKLVIELNPTNQQGYQKLLAILSILQKNQQYLNIATRVLQIHPKNPTFLILLAEAQIRMGKIQQSETSLKKAIQIQPERIQTVIALGDLYIAKSLPEKSLECYLEAEKKGIKNERLMNAIAARYSDLEQLQNAERYIQKSLILNPKHAPTYQLFAKLKMKTADYPEMERYLLKALEIDSNNIQANLLLGGVYFQTSRWLQAQKQLLKALELKLHLSQTFKCYLNLTNVYNNLAMYPQSLQTIIKAVDIMPDYKPALFMLGMAYVKNNQWQKGQQIMLKSYGEGCQTQQAAMMLAILFYISDPIRAIFYFKKTLQFNPQDIEANYGLGQVYYYLGQYEKANDYLQIVGELEPKDSEKISRIRKVREQLDRIKQRSK